MSPKKKGLAVKTIWSMSNVGSVYVTTFLSHCSACHIIYAHNTCLPQTTTMHDCVRANRVFVILLLTDSRSSICCKSTARCQSFSCKDAFINVANVYIQRAHGPASMSLKTPPQTPPPPHASDALVLPLGCLYGSIYPLHLPHSPS